MTALGYGAVERAMAALQPTECAQTEVALDGNPPRRYRRPMARRREHRPLILGRRGWSQSELSTMARDLVFDVLDTTMVDAHAREIVWGNGRRLPLELSMVLLHADSELPRGFIETHTIGWLRSRVPEGCSEQQRAEFDRLTREWLEDYARTSTWAKGARSASRR